MTALVVSVFVAALLGSVHCAGMCGGLACFVAGSADARATAAYNGGRLLSYLALGVVAGAAGAGFDRVGMIAGIARPAAIVAGFLMIVWGGATAVAAAGARVPVLSTPAGAGRALARALRVVRDRPPAQRGLVLGVLTPLLPCGWLYAFVVTAAAAGTPLAGALVMGAFWLGTVPVMAALGLGLQRASGPLRRRLPALAAAALIVIGLLTITGRFVAARTHAPAAAHPAPRAIVAPDGHAARS
ncbi:MAG TPA: sulfite exporter TauE/SafE family protein [Gemmatimonadaceae bacterium]|nr:sulfite exporter TauE/SafE family protein [Gemmatimonadaceae bacterium]